MVDGCGMGTERGSGSHYRGMVVGGTTLLDNVTGYYLATRFT